MKALAVCVLVVSAYFAIVYSTRCEHGDLTMCYEEISCNNDTKEVGCEHDTCTCVDKPEICLSKSDCVLTPATCKHGETVHCDNNFCVCLHAR